MADPNHSAEIWLPVPEYEHLYDISNQGRVRSWERRGTSGGECKLRVDKLGYVCVAVSKNAVQKFPKVHRLVLNAFVGQCPDGMEACHNNGRRDDNRLSNLRWDTRSANMLDCVNHGNCPHAKLTARDVLAIRAAVSVGVVKRLLCEQYGVTQSTINYIVSRKTWPHI